jgi:3-hydroxyisobutyrate dehydrogenase-like beta-hydroxyacid dehydrogenase
MIMTPQRIGILHPGEMGISLAAAAQAGGHEVYWASEGRSAATQGRAASFGLRDARTTAGLCSECTLLVGVCPPHAAEHVANEVAACGFTGVYLDANAIAPQRAVRLGEILAGRGAAFVDGGIIGPPAWKPKSTWLYLSGSRAGEVAACFSAGRLQTGVLGDAPGTASALKMCYAANTKGTTALLAAIMAAAERLGVRSALEEQWANEDPHSPEKVSRRVRGATAKAWRFEGEMEEIAATFREAGLPGEFHAAAADVYHRLAGFKDAAEAPPLEEVLQALLAGTLEGGEG